MHGIWRLFDRLRLNEEAFKTRVHVAGADGRASEMKDDGFVFMLNRQ